MAGERCGGCGWARAEKRADSADIDRFRCGWSADGDRCRYPGTMSGDTKGGGPWYCGEHFRCSEMEEGARIVRESIAKVVRTDNYAAEPMVALSRRAFRARECPPPASMPVGSAIDGSRIGAASRADPRDWARRILQRETAGERMPLIAVTSAREALGIA